MIFGAKIETIYFWSPPPYSENFSGHEKYDIWKYCIEKLFFLDFQKVWFLAKSVFFQKSYKWKLWERGQRGGPLKADALHENPANCVAKKWSVAKIISKVYCGPKIVYKFFFCQKSRFKDVLIILQFCNLKNFQINLFKKYMFYGVF